jgi:hypothetical protein
MIKFVALCATGALLLWSCGSDDSNVNPDPTPNTTELDSVVISQERNSDTINILIVKEDAAGAVQNSVVDRGAENHRSIVTFTSEKYTKGEVRVTIQGKRLSLLDPSPVLRVFSFSPTKTSLTDTLSGVIGAVSIASGAGTTCMMKGQILLLP